MENETLEETFIRLEFADWKKPEVIDEVLTIIKEIEAWQSSLQPERNDKSHFMLLFKLDNLVKERLPEDWAEVHKDDGVQELYKQLEDLAEDEL